MVVNYLRFGGEYECNQSQGASNKRAHNHQWKFFKKKCLHYNAHNFGVQLSYVKTSLEMLETKKK
jgi:hypothetical protein